MPPIRLPRSIAWRATAPVAKAAPGPPPPAPAKRNSPLLGLPITTGLTAVLLGVIAPSRMPVPGTIMRVPNNWPIDRLHAAALPSASTAANPEMPSEFVGTALEGAAWLFQPASALAPAIGEGAT